MSDFINYKFSKIFFPVFFYSLIFKSLLFFSEIKNNELSQYLNKFTISTLYIYMFSIILMSFLKNYSSYFYVFNYLINILFLFSDNANIEVFNNKNITKYNKRYYINCIIIGYLGLMTLVYLFKQREQITNSIDETLKIENNNENEQYEKKNN